MQKHYHRTQEEWVDLFNQQKASGLGVSTFCAEHRISTSSFYNNRNKLQPSTEGFIKADITQTSTAPSSDNLIILQYHHCTLHVPLGTSPQYLAQLMQSLS